MAPYTVRTRLFPLLIALLAGPLLQAQSPNGADAVQDLYAPVFAGAGAFTTSELSAPAASVNPAAAGAAQRMVIDAGYLALPGLGDVDGLGHAVELGALYPTKYAVFSGALRLISSPFDNLAVGTTLGGSFGAAKELYPGMSVGAGLNLGFGTDWTTALDLGFRQELGTRGALQDLTWALTLSGLGKSFAPSAFTPNAGIAFNFLRVPGQDQKPEALRLGAALDLGLPGFTNLTGKLGLNATLAELVTISGSTGFNLREALDGTAISPLPSIGITANFVLKSGGNRPAGALPSDGEVAATLAARPLYDGVWALGAGASWTVGVADKKAPELSVDYTGPTWISPNNDGKADAVEFPISIRDQRYVAEWTLEIQDQAGSPARTFRNKERRPETAGVRNIIDRLLDVKSGVEVPPTLRWDGILESGAVAPDGLYYFTLSARDDNGNAAVSARHDVVVDNTPPALSLGEAEDPLKIFSPDGDGNKDTFAIPLSGSVEDRWAGGIYDAAGTQVRSFDVTDGAPVRILWDGKDDSGGIVPDGVYTYRIAAVDRAQNAGAAVLDNIIVNTERPTVSLVIDQGYFSPNQDDVQDQIRLSPGVTVKEGIVGWTILVTDAADKTRRTFSGTQTAPTETLFDGRGDDGALLPEGSYKASLTLTYRNGHVSSAASPAFILDLTAPRGAVRTEYPAFSPNNDGKLDTMATLQDASAENAWTGEIRRAAGATGAGVLVRSFHFAGTPDPRLEWDGTDDAGKLVADGNYEYRLNATDRAGNSGSSNAVVFALSTADTPVLLSIDKRAFSPNGDGVKDQLVITPQLQISTGIARWKVAILDAAGTLQRGFEGNGLVPASLSWDGKLASGAVAPDGVYSARAELTYTMGNQPVAVSQTFTLDTKAPQAAVSAPFTLFSPNGDGRRDFVPILVDDGAGGAESGGADEWAASIRDAAGKEAAAWQWRGAAPSLAWNGTDLAGNPVPDGSYRFVMESTDEAGNRTRLELGPLTVDARLPRAFLTASAAAVSPNGDGQADDVRLGIILTPKDGIDAWRVDILDVAGTVARSFPSAQPDQNAPLPDSILWDGKDNTGAVREGAFKARLTVGYAKGDQVNLTTAPILVDVSGPVLGLDTRPDYFSPDNDGLEDELGISLTARDATPIEAWSLEIREPQPPYQVFYRLDGKGAPAERILWDGRSNKGELVQAATDYTATFTAQDALGNSGRIDGRIGVDVLVIREGDVLKIKVPSIIFRENGPDFSGLPPATVENNERVLKRIAQILNKFESYKVKVEGHANPVTRTASEEQKELQPLSEARAKSIMDKLVEFKVHADRLTYVGMGGTRPVVKWEDRNDWWKNRRVEFILIK